MTGCGHESGPTSPASFDSIENKTAHMTLLVKHLVLMKMIPLYAQERRCSLAQDGQRNKRTWSRTAVVCPAQGFTEHSLLRAVLASGQCVSSWTPSGCPARRQQWVPGRIHPGRRSSSTLGCGLLFWFCLCFPFVLWICYRNTDCMQVGK